MPTSVPTEADFFSPVLATFCCFYLLELIKLPVLAIHLLTDSFSIVNVAVSGVYHKI